MIRRSPPARGTSLAWPSGQSVTTTQRTSRGPSGVATRSPRRTPRAGHSPPSHHGSQASGYTQSVVLDDGTILTLGGTSDRADGDTGSWNKWVGHADLTAIRWRLED